MQHLSFFTELANSQENLQNVDNICTEAVTTGGSAQIAPQTVISCNVIITLLMKPFVLDMFVMFWIDPDKVGYVMKGLDRF
jgi:hypothetical protein